MARASSESKLIGYGEGFYGRPHSWEDRRHLAEFLGSHGLNAYVYAPKNDPYHRDRWREPYPEEFMRQFASLVELCAAVGVSFCYALSPLGMRFSSVEERNVAIHKLREFVKLGVRELAVLFDDVPESLDQGDQEAFKSLGQAHGATVAAMYDVLSQEGIRLAVAPTHYAGTEVTPYLKDLVSELPDDVALAWTGRYVLSPTITAGDVAERSRTLGHPVLVWDNFPVNDGPMGIWCHLGPWRGRDWATLEASAGLFMNGMEQARASKVAIAQLAQLVEARERFDPDTAWRKACLEVGGDAGEHFLVVAEQMYDSVCDPQPAPTLAALVERLEGLVYGSSEEASRAGEVVALRRALKEELARQQKALLGVRKSLGDRRLQEELSPWLEQMSRNLTVMTAAVRGWETARPEEKGGLLDSSEMFSLVAAVLAYLQPGGTNKAVHGISLGFRAVVQTVEGGWRISSRSIVAGRSLVERLVVAILHLCTSG